MTRIKRGVMASKRRKNILKKTKGYRYGRSNKYKAAKNAWIKAKTYAYRDRRAKKRKMRQLWNLKISAALKSLGTNYSKFVDSLHKNKVELDRKVLANLAQNEPQVFESVVKEIQK